MSKKFFENKKYLLIGICIGIVLGFAIISVVKLTMEKTFISIEKTITQIITKEITTSVIIRTEIKETTKVSEKGKVIGEFEGTQQYTTDSFKVGKTKVKLTIDAEIIQYTEFANQSMLSIMIVGKEVPPKAILLTDLPVKNYVTYWYPYEEDEYHLEINVVNIKYWHIKLEEV
jgi:hypothetical protein